MYPLGVTHIALREHAAYHLIFNKGVADMFSVTTNNNGKIPT